MVNGAIMLKMYAGYCFHPWFEVILSFSERRTRKPRAREGVVGNTYARFRVALGAILYTITEWRRFLPVNMCVGHLVYLSCILKAYLANTRVFWQVEIPNLVLLTGVP